MSLPLWSVNICLLCPARSLSSGPGNILAKLRGSSPRQNTRIKPNIVSPTPTDCRLRRSRKEAGDLRATNDILSATHIEYRAHAPGLWCLPRFKASTLHRWMRPRAKRATTNAEIDNDSVTCLTIGSK
ncbi:hypothetical protein M8818_002702 [Zalaria obscura]|uniref:Uncharacterized protein n=1 Tax=Zalaria obscura TaxID=2024903 RepID=A0ACC3SH17_9PEZI